MAKSSDRRLLRKDTGEVVLETLEYASTFWSRFWGLQFRQPLPTGHGIIVVPCGAVHTLWMRFPIDAYFLSKDYVVTEVRRNVRPWRVAIPSQGSHAVLETTAGYIDLEAGTPLAVDPI